MATEKGSAAFQAADEGLREAVAAMKTRRETERAGVGLATPCRKALESLDEHWEGLTRFVDDPRIPMDNNASERRARGPAVARKNFYGSGAAWSGRLAAALFSILATLSLWKLNPRRWLTWYFQRCAEAGGRVPEDIQPFLPWNLEAERKKELGEPAVAERGRHVLDPQSLTSRRRPFISDHETKEPARRQGTRDPILLRTDGQTG